MKGVLCMLLSVLCLSGVGNALTTQYCLQGGLLVVAQRVPQYITSPNYPMYYPINTDCMWKIHAPTDAYVVKIVVQDSYLEYSFTCSHDYVVAYDGPGEFDTQLNKWCGSNTPAFYSSGSYLTLRFHSDSSYFGPGFKLSFQEVPATPIPITLPPPIKVASTPAPKSEARSGLSTGAIVGIVLGVLFAVVVFCIICRCCCLRKKKPSDPDVPSGTAGMVIFRGTSGTTTSAHLTMNTAGSQVFFTPTSYTPNSEQTSVGPYPSAYAPPPYPGPAQPTPPQASAPSMGYAYTQPYAPGPPTGYPAQPPTFTAGPQGNSNLNRQQSIPKEPPPPYWMASQYEVQPGQLAGAVSHGAEGQREPASPGAGPTSGPATQQTAQGTASAAGPRSDQAGPAGRDNAAFVADDV